MIQFQNGKASADKKLSVGMIIRGIVRGGPAVNFNDCGRRSATLKLRMGGGIVESIAVGDGRVRLDIPTKGLRTAEKLFTQLLRTAGSMNLNFTLG